MQKQGDSMREMVSQTVNEALTNRKEQLQKRRNDGKSSDSKTKSPRKSPADSMFKEKLKQFEEMKHAKEQKIATLSSQVRDREEAERKHDQDMLELQRKLRAAEDRLAESTKNIEESNMELQQAQRMAKTTQERKEKER